MDFEENVPEITSPILPDIELQKKKEEARERYKKLSQRGKKPVIKVVTGDGVIKGVDKLTVKEQEEQFIKCALDPIYFIETYLKIFDQTQGENGMIVPFKLFQFQKDLITEYLNNDFNIANKYRQAGISTCTCAYLAWYVMFNKNRSVAIIADKLGTAQDELMNDVVEFIESCPTWLKPKPTRKNTQKLKRYDNGSEIGAFAAKSGLRGYTPTLLFWDETAWTEKSDKFWESAGPTLQTGGSAIMVSTPNGYDAIFYKTFNLALQKKNNFKAIELYWFNDPRYNKNLKWYKNRSKEDEIVLPDQDFTNEKRLQLYRDNWEPYNEWMDAQYKRCNGDVKKINQEILGKFLGSGDNFIAGEYLGIIEEKQVQTPIRQEYVDSNMWIWEDPIPSEEYVMSIDVSSGHGDDYSTINILKLSEFIENVIITKNGINTKQKVIKYKIEQVAEYYGKVSPQTLGEIGYIYGSKYNNAYTVIDITSGHGGQTVGKLFEIGYTNIHYCEIAHKPSRDMLNGYIKKGKKTLSDGNIIYVDLVPGFFIGSVRASVLIEFQRAIHMGDLIIRSKRTLEELKTFITVGGSRVADHGRSFHDDSIMGMAIGVYTINFDMKKYKVNDESTKDMINTMLKINNNERLKSKNNRPSLFDREFNNPYGANAWLFKGLNK